MGRRPEAVPSSLSQTQRTPAVFPIETGIMLEVASLDTRKDEHEQQETKEKKRKKKKKEKQESWQPGRADRQAGDSSHSTGTRREIETVHAQSRAVVVTCAGIHPVVDAADGGEEPMRSTTIAALEAWHKSLCSFRLLI